MKERIYKRNTQAQLPDNLLIHQSTGSQEDKRLTN